MGSSGGTGLHLGPFILIAVGTSLLGLNLITRRLSFVPFICIVLLGGIASIASIIIFRLV